MPKQDGSCDSLCHIVNKFPKKRVLQPILLKTSKIDAET